MKKILVTIFSVGIIFFLTGCSNASNESTTNDTIETTTKETISNSINLNNIKSKIDELGINTTEDEVFYQMVGATNGIKLYSGEYRVEIYQFDKSSEDYKTAEKSQKLSIDEDYSFDAVVKNGYAYIIDDEFPQHDEVVNLLNQLK